jgi:hypothetical protein
MLQFYVDDDLAALVEKLAKPKPFENLSFNDALRRVLLGGAVLPTKIGVDDELEQSLASRNIVKKAVSPSASQWVASVPELKSKKGLTNWKAICVALKIDVAGDSARRKLKNWVKANRPSWPAVPDID